MKQITNLFESKRTLGGLILLATLIGTTYSIQENSIKMKRLSNFESGMQTCFSRVNQTYTAKMLGDNASNYLTQNFQNLTEECFAEGILNIEDSFKSELASVAKKLSTLASNVHWFHEDILSPGSAKAMANTEENESRDVGSRFEKIETTKDEILEASDSYKNVITNSLNQEKILFYVSSILLIFIMLAEFMSSTRRRVLNLTKEREAEAELLDNGGIGSVKLGEIIRSALEQNELINCSKLFANFHLEYSVNKNIKGKNNLGLENLVTPASMSAPLNTRKDQEKIEKIWNDDSVGVSVDSKGRKNLEEVSLESLSTLTIDLLADKIFSQGIKLDIKIPENLFIKGSEEVVSQTLYHLINYAINATGEESAEKNISIFAHRLGDVVAFDLIHSGLGFQEEVLRHRVGISHSNDSLNLDLQICQSLLEEIQAKIQLDNKMNQNGEVVGGRVKIIFKSGALVNRLVDLKVGSKKEILAKLNSVESDYSL